MKKICLLLSSLFYISTLFAQHELLYQTYAKGSDEGDTSFISVLQYNDEIKIFDQQEKIENPIPGHAEEITFANYHTDSIFNLVLYQDGEMYYSSTPFRNEKLTFSNEGDEMILGYPCTKFKTSINSNTIEIWMTEKFNFQATPIPSYGMLSGTMIRCARNGSHVTDLKSVKKSESIKRLIPDKMGTKMTSKDLSQLKKKN
jgi:hypothetical protein